MIDQQIVIIGFMGAGKTSVANELASQLNRHANDLDVVITQNERRSPKEIIEQDGEDAFRRIESGTLRQLLLETSPGVLALGGGAWTIAENRKMIREQRAVAVWLDAPFELCWKRIETGREERPLARSREMAEALYTSRRSIYALADVSVPVNKDENPEEIATKVAQILMKQTAHVGLDRQA